MTKRRTYNSSDLHKRQGVLRYDNDYNKKRETPKKRNILTMLFEKQGELDFTFLTLVIVIVCFGIIMVFSASSPKSLRTYGTSYRFVIKQIGFAAVGFIGMLAFSKMDYRYLRKYAKIAMIICIIVLALVAFTPLGVEHNGAKRWLNIGMEIQPSEFMKPIMAMFIADCLHLKKYDIRTLPGLARMLVWVGIVGVLMIAEPHVSGAVVICSIAGIVMLCGGAKWKHILPAGAMVVAAGGLYVFTDSVRWSRITTAFDPFASAKTGGYQVIQGLYAIASGGIFGRGLGQGIQKRSFLPEPYNDYIFAVICEELGLIGAILVIVLFVALIIRGITIAFNSPDLYGTLIVIGIMGQIAVQTVLNILVVTALVPNTGITLPFFSYGGSALMVLMCEMGIVLNVSRHRKRNRI